MPFFNDSQILSFYASHCNIENCCYMETIKLLNTVKTRMIKVIPSDREIKLAIGVTRVRANWSIKNSNN